ncbi:hypothetical protein BJX66DRAFT_314153, partial [Aspergillus keveii]
MNPRRCVSAFPPFGNLGVGVLVVGAHVGLVRACLSCLGLEFGVDGHGARTII